MNFPGPAALMLIVLLGAAGADGADGPVLARSKSGQFVVRGLPVDGASVVAANTNAVDYVRLDPSVLTISLERIKTALLAELRQSDGWRGTIYVTVQPRLADNQPVTITSLRHADGWNYRVVLPEIITRHRFVQSVVQVLLMEMANRAGGSQQAELPPWLVPGLAAQLLAESPSVLIPELYTKTVRLQRPGDSLRPAIEQVRTNGPLTLNQLNLPDDEFLEGPSANQYRSCARLLVVSLLRLKDGSGNLGRMIALLSENLNWQTAFLQAFAAQFRRLVDADKWWSLQVVRLTGQAPNRQWNTIETLRQLEDILDTPVEIRETPEELPTVTLAGLPAVLQRCSFEKQQPILKQKLEQLAALVPRSPAAVAGLVEDYRRTLEGYLADRVPPRDIVRHRHVEPPSARMVVNATLRQLGQLDLHRFALSQLPQELIETEPKPGDVSGEGESVPQTH